MVKSGIMGFGLLSLAHSVFASVDHDSIRVIIKYKEQIKSISYLKSQIKQLTQLPVKELNPMAN